MTTIAPDVSGQPAGEPQAVPTTYAGIRFRSRLEARWAWILDQFLRGRWEYEPRTFGWADRGYLPDFHVHLPDGRHVWLEVKPPLPFEELTRLGGDAFEYWIPGERVSAETGDAFVAVFGLPTVTDDPDVWGWRTWPNAVGQVALPWITRIQAGCREEILNPSSSGESYGESTWTPLCGRCIECVGFRAGRLRFRDDGTHYLWSGRERKAKKVQGSKRSDRRSAGSR